MAPHLFTRSGPWRTAYRLAAANLTLTLGAEDIGKRIRPAEGARVFIPLVRVFIPLVNVADTASAITLSARGSKLSTGSI
jgi:hypothetical protein